MDIPHDILSVPFNKHQCAQYKKEHCKHNAMWTCDKQTIKTQWCEHYDLRWHPSTNVGCNSFSFWGGKV